MGLAEFTDEPCGVFLDTGGSVEPDEKPERGRRLVRV
jgi:hypothetical protein